LYDLDLDPMTLILDLNLHVLNTCIIILLLLYIIIYYYIIIYVIIIIINNNNKNNNNTATILDSLGVTGTDER